MACSPQRATIHVTLNGLTSEVDSLSIGGTLAGRELDGKRQSLRPASSSFDINLQEGDTGLLQLDIGGLAVSGCQIGAGSSMIEITDSSSYDAELTLSYDSKYQGCRLIIVNRGIGTGKITKDSESDVDKTTCDFSTTTPTQCESTYPLGTQVKLTAAALSGSYFAGWTGACSGTSSCTITVDAMPQTVQAGLLPTKLCVGSICWQHPLPQGSNINAIFGTASNDLWMVGEEGTILHWNGVYTEAGSSPSSELLHALWGNAGSSVWAVGDNGAIVHWDGTTWSAETANTAVSLYGLWGESADSVWAVGDKGTVLQRTSGSWSPQSTGSTATLTSIWGSDATTSWAVGKEGTILQRNGTVWTLQNSGTIENLNGIWGTSASNVWAVGDGGTIPSSNDCDSIGGRVVEQVLDPLMGCVCILVRT